MTEPGLPTIEEATATFLDSLKNEDEQWLWEIVWVLNTRAPDAATTTKVAMAREIVTRLEGLIELGRGVWPGGPVERLTEVEINRLAIDDLPWHDPARTDLSVVVRETDRA